MSEFKNLLKYVGSKHKLLDKIEGYIPKDTTLLVEPFCGSASLSLSRKETDYYLTDASPELINFLQCVRDNPREVIRHVRAILLEREVVQKEVTNKDYFETVRNSDRDIDFLEWNPLKRAARYYYVIYHCFNGVYRVNQKGFCNISHGGDIRKLPDDWKDRIIQSSIHLKKFCRGIFEHQFDDRGLMQSILDSQKEGEKIFVFIDPIYHNTFDMYTAEGTRFDFWERLKLFIDSLDKAGIPFLCTNTHDDFILDLFNGYKIDKIPVKYTVSNNGKRPTTFEAFITNKVEL